MGRGLADASRMLREAANTIESLRYSLQELQSVGGESRYSELFGTPERAARTLETVAENLFSKAWSDDNATLSDVMCSLADHCKECPARGLPGRGVSRTCGEVDYESLLEWLKGDITDERYTDLELYASGRDDFENWVSLNLKAMMDDILSPNPFKTLEERKKIVEKYKHEIVDVLPEWLRDDSDGE